jgi:Fibronectin type III domain/Secretion system C-terminal sorting domain
MKRILLLITFLASFATNGFSQTPCSLTPSAIVAIPRVDGALVFWVPTGATLYEVQYRVAIDSAVWVSVNVQSTSNTRDTASLQITRLTACTNYSVRVRAKCTGTVSDWRTTTFKTLGCPEPCAVPRGLFATARDSSAVIGWTATTGTGVTYVVQVKGLRDSLYQTINATTNTLTLNHLRPCTEYYFNVKAVCSAASASSYSEVARFKTSGCVAPCTTPREMRAITEGNSNKINFLWIGASTLGYEVQHRIRDSAWSASTRVTALNFKLENTRTCTPYSFRVRAICAQTGTTFLYSEWSGTATAVSSGCVVTPRCDAPHRLSYVPANTTTLLRWDTAVGVAGQTYNIEWMGARDSGVWRSIANVRGNQYNLTGLATCQKYMFRVKTNCSATSSSTWSQPITFQTLGCTPLCSKPKGLKAFVNDTSVVFSWDRADLSSYTLVVKSTDGSFATRSIAVTGFNHTLSGLLRCKTYTATLVTNCTDGRVSETATIGFTTITRTCASNNDNCKVADVVINTTNDSTVVEGIATILASTFELQYRKATDSAWSAPISAARPRFVLRGLTRCLTYVVRVRAICTTGAGEWKTKEFRAGAACFANPNGDGSTELLSSGGSVSEFAVYPNPGHEALGLSYKLAQDATIDIQLVNLQGQVVSKLNGGLQEAGNYNQVIENLGDLNNGIYMLVVRANGKVLATQKWNKQ